MWIYSSGFPKSQDIGKSIDRAAGKKNELKDRGTKGTKGNKIVKNSPGSGTLCPGCGRDSNARYSCNKGQECGMVYKPQTKEAEQWLGWGTALKTAHEPIALARKPIKLSIAKNCQKWGVGALNIDATRVPYDDGRTIKGGAKIVKMDEAWSENLDKTSIAENNWTGDEQGRFPSNVLGEIPDYQKYFYCPKVSRKERHTGFELPPAMFGGVQGCYDENGERYAVGLDARTDENKGNNHPTVKPVELMKYLIKLVTPPGGTVLDPFAGSGSTGMAAVELGHPYIGCELDAMYVAIAKTRIEAWHKQTHANTYAELFELC
jgi:site-specific DNA-methyltransferase (adenine-specific)